MENYQEENGGNKTLWIIIGVVAVIAIIGIVYGATQRTIKKTGNGDDTEIPALNETGDQVKLDETQIPAGHVAVPVTYTGFDVVNLQTFPHRVQVRVRGTVPEGCVVAQKPSTSVSGKVFTVSMTASKAADAMCTQVITNVEGIMELPVEGLVAGAYTVKLGTMTKTFTLAQENTIQYSGDK